MYFLHSNHSQRNHPEICCENRYQNSNGKPVGGYVRCTTGIYGAHKIHGTGMFAAVIYHKNRPCMKVNILHIMNPYGIQCWEQPLSPYSHPCSHHQRVDLDVLRSKGPSKTAGPPQQDLPTVAHLGGVDFFQILVVSIIYPGSPTATLF